MLAIILVILIIFALGGGVLAPAAVGALNLLVWILVIVLLVALIRGQRPTL